MVGKTLTTESGNEIEILEELGSGGQGKVYRARINGQDIAFKWYHPHIATADLKQRIEEAIALGVVSDSFLWPRELVVEGDRFGYIMPLLESRFKTIPDLMARRIAPNFTTLIIAGYNLVNAFRQLHLKGKCYRDISIYNVLFDPDNGDIKIIDNDNVMTNNKPIGEVITTSGFAAPEVMLGKAKPSTDTDLFSLAVLLFYFFFDNHPLEGKRERMTHCLDDKMKKKLYAEKPLYIFHPTDTRNRPVPGEQNDPILLEKIYPKSFKKVFERAFTDGLNNPRARVRETEWEDALLKLLNQHTICQKCGSECFVDWEEEKRCYNCKEKLSASPYIAFFDKHSSRSYYKLLLHPKSSTIAPTYVYPVHFKIYDNQHEPFKNPIFQVIANPKNPRKWGLKNLSGQTIQVTTANGDTKDVANNKVIPVIEGIHFTINNKKAQIKGE